MKINIVPDVKEQFITSLTTSLYDLKDKVSLDILNFELAILYNNRIYGEDSAKIQEIFTKLSNDIDEILNQFNQNCCASIETLFDANITKVTQAIEEYAN